MGQKPAYRNKLATHKTLAEKQQAYQAACIDSKILAMAYYSDGTSVPLVNVDMADVEFIGGLWRVQDAFSHKVRRVRDIDIVLADKLPHTERIPFEYWRAYRVSENCYGRYLSPKPDIIVAKYETEDGAYWGYGSSIEQARAFLGIKLFDQYMDLIHTAVGKKFHQK